MSPAFWMSTGIPKCDHDYGSVGLFWDEVGHLGIWSSLWIKGVFYVCMRLSVYRVYVFVNPWSCFGMGQLFRKVFIALSKPPMDRLLSLNICFVCFGLFLIEFKFVVVVTASGGNRLISLLHFTRTSARRSSATQVRDETKIRHSNDRSSAEKAALPPSAFF
jgi:hypothetical protein